MEWFDRHVFDHYVKAENEVGALTHVVESLHAYNLELERAKQSTPSELENWYSVPKLRCKILWNELRDAIEYRDELASRLSDATAYAPGGEKYEAIRHHWCSNASTRLSDATLK